MLREDYLKEPNGYYENGIRFFDGGNSRSYNTGVLKVNGEVYYDIRFALEQYEEAVRKKTDEVERLNSQIRELQEDIADMKKNFPTLKQAIEEWQKYQKENYQEDYL
jgi:chromosome segregation ATPase